MQRPHFKFQSSWLEALELITDPTVKAQLALAIVEYGITGRAPTGLDETGQVVMALIMPQIDAANRPRKPRTEAPAVEPQNSGVADTPLPASADTDETTAPVPAVDRCVYVGHGAPPLKIKRARYAPGGTKRVRYD